MSQVVERSVILVTASLWGRAGWLVSGTPDPEATLGWLTVGTLTVTGFWTAAMLTLYHQRLLSQGF